MRDYMEYHSDRFEDYSLMLCDEHGRIEACMPACVEGDTLYSHRGLTYGGWLIPDKHFTVNNMLEGWELMNKYLRTQGILRLVYKPVPHIYHTYPCEEDLYALFRNEAVLTASSVSTTIDLNNPIPFNKGANCNLKNAIKSNIKIDHSKDYETYWALLSRLLNNRYNATPVHSLDEITTLAKRFPDNIRLLTASLNGEMVAGTVLYITNQVVHAQYIAASDRGKETNATTLLFRHILDHECAGRRYFDFGTSCEEKGRYLNTGLIAQKCGMGGRAIVYNEYTVEIR